LPVGFCFHKTVTAEIVPLRRATVGEKAVRRCQVGVRLVVDRGSVGPEMKIDHPALHREAREVALKKVDHRMGPVKVVKGDRGRKVGRDSRVAGLGRVNRDSVSPVRKEAGDVRQWDPCTPVVGQAACPILSACRAWDTRMKEMRK
jgi:hypothetical protein